MNNLVLMFILTVYVKRYQSVSAYLTEIKAYFPRTERILYYNSLIKPLTLYCSVTWISSCSQDNFDQIFMLQERCARIMLDDEKYHGSVHVDLFKILGRLTYYVETEIKRRLIAYKRISGACSDYRNDLLELNSGQHSTNTRGAYRNIWPTRYNRAKSGGGGGTHILCDNFLTLE